MKKTSCQGNILIVALIMIVVISGFVGVALNTTNNTSRLTDRSRDYATAQAAAEGAVEYAYGIWKQRLVQNPAASVTGMAGPAFSGLTYSTTGNNPPLQIDPLDQYGVITNTATPVIVDLTTPPAWRGRTYNYLARAKIQSSGSNNFTVGVRRQFQYSEVPLFQAMYFFEHNLEIYRPAPIIVSGLVHTNARAYLSGSSAGSLTFQSNVSYVEGYSESTDPPYSNTWSGWAPNSEIAPIYPNGQANQVKQVGRIEPIGKEPLAVLDTTDANPNNDTMREIIEPPNTSYPDPPEIAKRRLYNKAGLLININGGTISVTGRNGSALSSAQQTAIRDTISAKTTIYDQREGKNVEVSSIDIGALKDVIDGNGNNGNGNGNGNGNNGISGFNDVIYINDTTPITALNPKPKAVRLQNGGVLPDGGLTVASENPIYIQGDYNTGTTVSPLLVPANATGNPTNSDRPTVPGYTRKPSSVIGDAVMLLSNSWSDANSSLGLTSRDASNTTFNTAIISGFMQSGYQPTVGSQYGYSGGAINFPRFLEDWGGNACTYYGSMVELFQSKTATGRWDTGVIYRPPARRFNFDTQFTDNPPPGGVNGVTFSRGTWAKY